MNPTTKAPTFISDLVKIYRDEYVNNPELGKAHDYNPVACRDWVRYSIGYALLRDYSHSMNWERKK